ncbi:hypothetical protein DesyoDRAFT_5247 [Desulfosporosinus youngiae DSM 17734]|uniref:Uncharacterized protein n=1 Tax=Desulfosporosinus youngiae DSM 17734 TaxID=768710 RepID=H5XZY0_9FIRM|nr:hypothetical protein DesyoDRAFT_5247 [Desulfosporosinus youngiae DSM 17734]
MLVPTCLCGQAISFRRRKTVARCRVCGVRWERDKTGCWALGLNTVLFTPYLARRGRARR